MNKEKNNAFINFIFFIYICQRFNPDFQNPHFLYVLIPIILDVGIISIALMKSTITLVNKNYIIWMGAFTALCLFSYAWSSYPADSMKNFLYNNLITMLPLSLYLTSEERIESFVKYIILATLITLVYAIVFSDVSIGLADNALRLGGGSTTWNSNNIGTMSAICTILSYVMMEVNKQKKYLLVIIFCICVALISGSRKALLLSMLGIFIFNLVENGWKKYYKLVASVLLIIIVYFVIMNVKVFYDAIGVRIESAVSGFLGDDRGADSSFIIRRDLIDYGFKTFLRHPIKGVGVDSFRYYYYNYAGKLLYAHNNYIEMLADLGIIGFTLYYSLLVNVLVKSIMLVKNCKTKLFRLIPPIIAGIIISDYAGVSYNSRFVQVVLLIGIAVYNCERNIENECKN